MENKEYQFKTNINCGGCISKVKPVLDTADGVSYWNVDTNQADKVLTISSKGITEKEVIDLIKSQGFQIEALS